MVDMFADFYAMTATVLILGVSFLIFRRETLSVEGINSITEFSFYLSLCVSIVWLAYTLLTISGTGELGNPLSFCLMMLLYAAILRLIGILVVRFKKGGKA